MEFRELLGKIEGEHPATREQVERAAKQFRRLSGIDAPAELREFWAVSNGLNHDGLYLVKAGGGGPIPSLSAMNADLGDDVWTLIGTRDDDLLAYCAGIERWVVATASLDIPTECDWGVYDTCEGLLRHALSEAFDLDLPEAGCTAFEPPPAMPAEASALPSIDALVSRTREERPRWLRRPKKAEVVAQAYRDAFGVQAPEAWLRLMALTNGVEADADGIYGVGRAGWDLADWAKRFEDVERFREIGNLADRAGQRVQDEAWGLENCFEEEDFDRLADCDEVIRWVLAKMLVLSGVRLRAPDPTSLDG